MKMYSTTSTVRRENANIEKDANDDVFIGFHLQSPFNQIFDQNM